MALTQKEKVDEILKCGKDPCYFIKNYLYIQHPVKGRLPFKLFPFQEECIESFVDYKYNIVLKSRQLGLSTTTAAYCLWLAIFRQDANILLMATKLEVGKGMIAKIRTAFKMLPPWMLALLELKNLEAESVKYVGFSNGSKITAIPTSKDAARGEAVTLLVVDEAAHIENLEELWMGLWSTVSTGGRAIVFSTPKGKNFFQKMWEGADTGKYVEGKVGEICDSVGKNGFHGIRLPWYVHPERDETWFEDQAKALDERGVAQELMCSFQGSTLTFFSQASMDYVRNLAVAPLGYSGPSEKSQDLHVWKTPDPAHKYLLAADVARGDADDFSAFHIFDMTTSEVVAEYLGKIPPDRFGEWIVSVATKYNNALVVSEKNSVGLATSIKLRDSGYENLYFEPELVDKMMTMTPDEKKEVLPGFTITPKNRGPILENLEQVIRNQHLRLFSTRFLGEMETFIWNGKRGQALKKRHDDLIMAMAIGLQIFTPNAEQQNYLGMLAANQTLADNLLLGMSRGEAKPKKAVRGYLGTTPETASNVIQFQRDFWWVF